MRSATLVKESRLSLADLTSRLATALRMSAGTRVNSQLGPRPAEPVILYEFEACPFCRKVREAISDLDLTAEIRPCPKGGKRFRPSVQEIKSGATFPFMIDPNTDTEMFESADIVRYLYDNYGVGNPPSSLTSPFFLLSSQAASLARGVAGAIAKSSEAPDEPLVLEGFEGDPQARLVRERLCELELPYIRRNADVVRLIDPTSGQAPDGADDIIAYLGQTWAR